MRVASTPTDDSGIRMPAIFGGIDASDLEIAKTIRIKIHTPSILTATRRSIKVRQRLVGLLYDTLLDSNYQRHLDIELSSKNSR